MSIAIVQAALERLSPGGTLLLYTGVAIMGGRDPFFEAVAPKIDKPDIAWEYEEIDPDVFGEELAEAAYGETERIAAVGLQVTRCS